MSYRTVLTIENQTYQLLKYMSFIQQATDQKGKPSSEVRAGLFEMAIQGTNDDFFPTWASDKTKTYDGSIITYGGVNQDEKVKELDFKQAYITMFCESFVVNPDEDWLRGMHLSDRVANNRLERIVDGHQEFQSNYFFWVEISSGEVTIDGIEHKNKQ